MQRGKDGIFRQIRQIRKKLAGWLDHVMNDMSLRRKLILMYLLCMLLPLMVTDGIILTVLFRGEKASRQQEMKNTAEAISYSLSSRVEDAVHLARNIYGNRYVNEFLERTYSSPLEYYNSRLMLLRESLYETGVRSGSNYAVIYAENPTIVNGGYFCRTDLAEEKEWTVKTASIYSCSPLSVSWRLMSI